MIFRSRISFGMARSIEAPVFIESTETVVGYADRPVPIRPLRFNHIADFPAYLKRRAGVEMRNRRASLSSKPQSVGR